MIDTCDFRRTAVSADLSSPHMNNELNFLEHFSNSHVELRDKFLKAATLASAQIVSYTNPALGPSGESLYTDVARVGTMQANKVLLLVAGTHGVEGYCGSACLVGWLREHNFESLAEDVAVVLVNLINPYGTAWQRRQNEDNVDLNRNFIKHGPSSPANPDYDRLHDLIVLENLEKETVAHAERQLTEFIQEQGEEAFSRAMTAQYDHADGLFYGGSQAVWSNQTLQKILGEHCADAEHVAFIDYHSGMGPFGYGMPISPYNISTEESLRARSWFGDSLVCMNDIDPHLDSETIAEMYTSGTMDAVLRMFPEKTVTALTLEFGTYAFEKCIAVMREDAWLHKYGDPLSEEGLDIRRRWLKVFYPNTPDWLEMIWWRSEQVIAQALAGLAASGGEN